MTGPLVADICRRCNGTGWGNTPSMRCAHCGGVGRVARHPSAVTFGDPHDATEEALRIAKDAADTLSQSVKTIAAQRDAALAEVERLKAELATATRGWETTRKDAQDLATLALLVREEERKACAALARADLLDQPGVTCAAPMRFDGGASERAALRIAAAIEARGATASEGGDQ